MRSRKLGMLLSVVLILSMLLSACGGKPTATPVPATEVPATEVPATEVPATEVPATEVPATEVPPTEVPATEVPATEVPATEVPATEVPATDCRRLCLKNRLIVRLNPAVNTRLKNADTAILNCHRLKEKITMLPVG